MKFRVATLTIYNKPGVDFYRLTLHRQLTQQSRMKRETEEILWGMMVNRHAARTRQACGATKSVYSEQICSDNQAETSNSSARTTECLSLVTTCCA